MAQQLGSNPRVIANGSWDMRLLSDIRSSDRLPDQLKPMLYAGVRSRVVDNGESFWSAYYDEYLHLLNSIDGGGKDYILRAENARNGIPVQITPPPERPSLADRLLDREKVQEYERWKERRELGLE